LSFFMTPTKMAEKDNECAQCHDSGPFIRTPYVWQMEDRSDQALDGRSGDAVVDLFPKRTEAQKVKYSFPEFDAWNQDIFNVSVKTAVNCTACHNMGTNQIDPNDTGTSAWLGPMSVGTNKTPHHADAHATWMIGRVRNNPEKQDPEKQDLNTSLT